MKYLALAIFVLFLSGCDYKKVEEGEAKATPAMKCGAGKCGAAMMKKEEKKAPVMKCAPGKCGAAMQTKEKKDAPVMKCAPGKCGSSMK